MEGVSSTITKAGAYGGVLLARDGLILLREPADHFGGYAWTFAKGRPEPGDSPQETALREVYEETGYHAEIIGVLPDAFHGDTGSTAFFVMRPLAREPDQPGWETWHLCWANFEHAAKLIQRSSSKKGQQRDLAILRAVSKWLDEHLAVVLPEACRDRYHCAQPWDWPIQVMPEQHCSQALDLPLSEQQARAIRKGFVPQAMEDKWFAWFADNVLHLHRSWSGFCIYQIHFANQGKGLRATHFLANRCQDQYSCQDAAEDQQQVLALLQWLQNGAAHAGNGLLAALQSAAQPNYLGSPDVLAGLLGDYILERFACCQDAVAMPKHYQENARLAQIFSGQHPDYVALPAWHTRAALGETLMDCMGLDRDYCAGETLAFLVSEALAALDIAVGAWFDHAASAAQYGAEPDIQAVLSEVRDFVVSVFLGTRALSHPRQRLADFAPPARKAGGQVLDGFDLSLRASDDRENFYTEIDCDEPADAGGRNPETRAARGERAAVSPSGSNPSSTFETLLNELQAISNVSRQSPLDMSLLDINPGDVLQFKLAPDITCTVLENNRVRFDGATLSLSAAAVRALQAIGRTVTAARGPDYWLHGGKTLTALRKRQNPAA